MLYVLIILLLYEKTAKISLILNMNPLIQEVYNYQYFLVINFYINELNG
jgi:hypothetical protein